MTCSLENLVSISFYASEHIFFCENVRFFDTNHKNEWRNSHNYHAIIFYLNYINHLFENNIRTISFFTFRTIEKLFFVLSYFRFYEMNFFHWNLMAWEAFIPKYSSLFRVTRKIFSLGSSRENCQAEILLRITRKNTKNMGITASHGIKFQQKKFIS